MLSFWSMIASLFLCNLSFRYNIILDAISILVGIFSEDPTINIKACKSIKILVLKDITFRAAVTPINFPLVQFDEIYFP